jgi:hypothetical protein
LNFFLLFCIITFKNRKFKGGHFAETYNAPFFKSQGVKDQLFYHQGICITDISSSFLLCIFIFIILLFKFFIVLGYIMTFTKVITIYRIYHSWIYPLYHSPLFSFPHSWNSFNRSHFPIYTHVYTVFVPYSPFFLSHIFPPLTGTNSPERTCSAHLFSVLKKIKWHFCLFKIAMQGVSLWHFYVL